MFIGPNRPFGARLSYVINKPAEVKKEEPAVKDAKKPETRSAKKRPDESQVAPITKDSLAQKTKTDSLKKEPPKPSYDSLTMEIFNAKNEKIRTIKRKAPDDAGLNRMTWSLNEKGVRYPSREKARPGAPEPGGVTVLPGTYKVRLTFGDAKDSATLTVKSDPRYNTSPQIIEERYAMLKSLDKLTALASDATTRLRESKDIADDYEKRMKDAKKDEYKQALEKTKVVKDSIDALFDFIVGKEDKRQGITRQKDPTPISYIGNASYYISSSYDPVNDTDRRVVKFAEDQVQQVLDRVNAFYEKTWVDYRNSMQNVVISPFKDYQPLKK
jgi:hypothetical protein